MKAFLRKIRVSSKKANLVADLVRNKSVEDAVNILRFTPKKTAPILKKLIESAAANAVNNFKQESSSLFIKEIIVNEGPTYKRSIPISRGRTHPVRKRTAHIAVHVESSVIPTKVEKEVKAEVKEETAPKTEVKAEKSAPETKPKETTKTLPKK